MHKVFRSLKAPTAGISRANFTNLALQAWRGNLLILKGQWPGTGRQKKSNIADYFESPRCLLPFVLWASKSEVCCGLNLENCQRSKEDGQVAYCCAALSPCNKLRYSINLMEFGPLALRSLVVIITQKIVQPKLCWTTQILTIIFNFCNEPLKKVVLRASAWAH